MRLGRPPKPLTDGQERRIAFPIASDHAGFTKTDSTAKHLERVCGVPAAAIGVIESVQPYHAGHEPLGALDQLVKTDKHRTLLLCAGLMQMPGRFPSIAGTSWHGSLTE